MLKNGGSKIKDLAVCFFVVELFLLFIVSLLTSAKSENIILFFPIFIVGLLISLFSTIPLYALGEIIENSQIIRDEAKNQTELLKEIRGIIKNNSTDDTNSEKNSFINSNHRTIQNWLDGNGDLNLK